MEPEKGTPLGLQSLSWSQEEISKEGQLAKDKVDRKKALIPKEKRKHILAL
tara:strand:- start:514 stop:666 length:153 start_codon:yes stop_codon:yes gene_type:complete